MANPRVFSRRKACRLGRAQDRAWLLEERATVRCLWFNRCTKDQAMNKILAPLGSMIEPKR